MATAIIAAVIFGLVAWIIYKRIKAYQKGESTCGCGCSKCPSAKNCHSTK